MTNFALLILKIVPFGRPKHDTIPSTVPPRLTFFSIDEFLVMKAIAGTMFVPSAPGEPTGDDLHIVERIDKLLSTSGTEVQSQFRQLLTLFNTPLIAFLFDFRFSAFVNMAPSDQRAYLEDWMTSSISFRRTVFQALKRICMSVAYADPRTWKSVGYDGPLKAIP